MYIYTYIYIHINIFIYIYIFKNIHKDIYIYVCIYIYIVIHIFVYITMHEQTEVCVYICVCVMCAIFTGVCVRVCVCASMYLYVYTHMYIHICICILINTCKNIHIYRQSACPSTVPRRPYTVYSCSGHDRVRARCSKPGEMTSRGPPVVLPAAGRTQTQPRHMAAAAAEDRAP